MMTVVANSLAVTYWGLSMHHHHVPTGYLPIAENKVYKFFNITSTLALKEL
jgi:hypothetical protein